MKCINFDDRFADFASQWMKDHGKEYRNYDAMEADMPQRRSARLLNRMMTALEMNAGDAGEGDT